MAVPVKPALASTVILVRDGVPTGEPWQVFMVRRHVRSDFAADVFVFPGGKVDPEDRDPALQELLEGNPGPDGSETSATEWKALRLAAIRELWEEAGVLLARDTNGGVLDLMAERGAEFDRLRRQMHAGGTTMAEIAETKGLRYLGDALHPFSRWITPLPFPRRFDTWFYVAVMPPRQMPIHDRAETTESTWISPEEALHRYEDGTFPLVFATEQHLRRMAQYASIEEMIASTEGADLRPVIPKPIERDGEQAFLLPGDPGYDEA